MTREQLNTSQTMYSAYDSFSRMAHELPEENPLAKDLIRLSLQIGDSFLRWTGHTLSEVKSLVELNNETPAEPWKFLKPGY